MTIYNLPISIYKLCNFRLNSINITPLSNTTGYGHTGDKFRYKGDKCPAKGDNSEIICDKQYWTGPVQQIFR